MGLTYRKRVRTGNPRCYGLDSSAPALEYALSAGFLDEAIHADLERDDPDVVQQKLLDDVDLVIGTRFADPGVVTHTPLLKRLVLRSAAVLSRRSRKLGLTDAHNGLRVFNKKVADGLNLTMNGMSHADEFIALAYENHWRVTEGQASG